MTQVRVATLLEDNKAAIIQEFLEFEEVGWAHSLIERNAVIHACTRIHTRINTRINTHAHTYRTRVPENISLRTTPTLGWQRR